MTTYIPRRLRLARPESESLEKLLREWNVRFAVFNLRNEQSPFESALKEYLSGFGPAVFERGDIRVYAVPFMQTDTAETSPS